MLLSNILSVAAILLQPVKLLLPGSILSLPFLTLGLLKELFKNGKRKKENPDDQNANI